MGVTWVRGRSMLGELYGYDRECITRKEAFIEVISVHEALIEVQLKCI